MDLAFALHAAVPLTHRNAVGTVQGPTRRNCAAPTDRRRSRIVSQEATPLEAILGEAMQAPTVEAGKASNAVEAVKEEKKVRLQALMSKVGVASSDTCGVMIENGFVRVNGEIITDCKARVKKTDYILVRGKELMPLKDDGADDDEESIEDLPRAQKDFGRSKVLSNDKFNWRVDGGFLSSKAGGRIR